MKIKELAPMPMLREEHQAPMSIMMEITMIHAEENEDIS